MIMSEFSAWLQARVKDGEVFPARHHLIVRGYNYPAIKSFLEDYARRCSGATWTDVAEKLARLGRWEFEDYKPYSP